MHKNLSGVKTPPEGQSHLFNVPLDDLSLARGLAVRWNSLRMKVFKVRPARDDFQELALDQRVIPPEKVVEIAMSLDCKGRPKPDWTPPPLHLRNPFKREPAFWGCPAGGAFAVHPRILPIVSMFLAQAGELLPLPFKRTEFQVLNILQVWDCINEDLSERYTYPSTGQKYGCKKPWFVPAHFEASTLFKIPERELDIYCWEHNKCPEEEFKACVEENKLTGLRFELVWSSKDD